MRRHRPALPAGCQAAGDVKSAAQNFKTSHKLPHPLCGALSLFPSPSPPPSCSCHASWPFLSLHCAKIKIYEGCKKQQRQRGGSERGGEARGGGRNGACCQGRSNERGKRRGRNECAKKFNAQMITNESSTAHKVVLHFLHTSPHSPLPRSTATPPFCTVPLLLLDSSVACWKLCHCKSNQRTWRHRSNLHCIAKKFLRKDEEREGAERDEEEGKSEWMQRMNECILLKTTHTHTQSHKTEDSVE